MDETYCEVKEKKEYTEQVRRWNNDTEASGSEMGADIEKLLNNDAYLKEQVDQMQLSGRDIVVPVASWSGSAAPYTVDITLQGAASDSTVYVLPHPDITPVQYKALAEAAIIGGDQGEGTVRLKAYGTKPTVDLPLGFLVSGIAG